VGEEGKGSLMIRGFVDGQGFVDRQGLVDGRRLIDGRRLVDDEKFVGESVQKDWWTASTFGGGTTGKETV